MSKAAVSTILSHMASFQLTTKSSQCPTNKLFLAERCVGGAVLEIPTTDLAPTSITQHPVIFCLIVEVYIRRARLDWESSWCWKPEHVVKASICFYHIDHELVLEAAATWLLEHADTTSPKHEGGRVGDEPVFTINCPTIKQLQHYTTMPEYKDGWRP